jgi:acetolactate synthase I/II/III large subunit
VNITTPCSPIRTWSKYAEGLGAKGYRVSSTALDQEGVSIIACPVDYAENLRLTDALGQLDGAL